MLQKFLKANSLDSKMVETKLVSVHGGHSGSFCNHATDDLEDIIQSYINKKFEWVCITEHMPPVNDDFLYPDEIEAGLNAYMLLQRFDKYIHTCRELKKKYKQYLKIFIGFETETTTGYENHIKKLVNKFKPDIILGSVHHVNDMCFDYSIEYYKKAVSSVGGIDELYCRYFDIQLEIIETLKPDIIAHFDLIRIFDPDYKNRINKPEIQKKILRNLSHIKKYDLILDFNVRALSKGQDEPYISETILDMAKELNISVIPGDDSHGVDSVGLNIKKGISILQKKGFNTSWKFMD